MRWAALALLLSGCVMHPRTPTDSPMRRVKKLHRVTYCGSAIIEFNVPRKGLVSSKVEVCSGHKDPCNMLLRAFVEPATKNEDAQFEWKACTAQTHVPIDAPERKYLRRNR